MPITQVPITPAVSQVNITNFPDPSNVNIVNQEPNAERYRQDNHWDCVQVTVAVAGAGGQQNLGGVVPAGMTRRIREITVRHAGSNNTVVTLLIAGGATRLTLDVPAQTTRVWSSEDGRVFLATVQPAVQTSDITGGSTYVSASGVEA